MTELKQCSEETSINSLRMIIIGKSNENILADNSTGSSPVDRLGLFIYPKGEIDVVGLPQPILPNELLELFELLACKFAPAIPDFAADERVQKLRAEKPGKLVEVRMQVQVGKGHFDRFYEESAIELSMGKDDQLQIPEGVSAERAEKIIQNIFYEKLWCAYGRLATESAYEAAKTIPTAIGILVHMNESWTSASTAAEIDVESESFAIIIPKRKHIPLCLQDWEPERAINYTSAKGKAIRFNKKMSLTDLCGIILEGTKKGWLKGVTYASNS